MNNYHKRLLTETLEETLRTFPVTVLTGARQTGKSTLMGHLPSVPKRPVLNLDDLDLLERAQKEPRSLIDSYPGPVAVDEVQRAPQLLYAIKQSVDEKREKGRFLLTGSANLLLMEKVSETLAGRAVFLTLFSMTEREKRKDLEIAPWESLFSLEGIKELSSQKIDRPLEWPARALDTGYPATLGLTPSQKLRWLEGYVQTYLERDLQQISNIENLPDFRRLMRLAAARVGSLVNQSELSRSCGLTQPTVHRYLNLLETSCQIIRLGGFSINRSKRVIKVPKLYWTDVGLACFLADITLVEDMKKLPNSGGYLENLVLKEMMAWTQIVVPKPSLFYWRTTSGIEVDFIVSWKGKLLPIEVKSSTRVSLADCRGLEHFIQDTPQASHGIVLYAGQRLEKLTPHIFACPLSLFI